MKRVFVELLKSGMNGAFCALMMMILGVFMAKTIGPEVYLGMMLGGFLIGGAFVRIGGTK